MNDFESTVKQLLNEHVDAALGPRRPAPRWDAAAPGRRGLRPWLVPLLATAGIAAATVAVVVPVQMLANRPVNGSAGLSGGSSGQTGPAATQPIIVQLADARIWLPAGWHATVSSDTPPPGGIQVFGNQSTTWCLGPAGKDGACRVWLERSVQEPAHGNADSRFDSDAPGGTPHSQSQICPDSSRGWSTLDAGDRNFGGRTADYRVFELTCGSGAKQEATQYLVPAGPAFALYAKSSDSALRMTMAEITQRSTLPKQTTALRYYDHGYVRDVKSVAGDRIQITIDRVAVGPGGPINNDPRTYQYDVPTFVWRINNVHLAVGDIATVQTDGTTVFDLYRTPV